MNIRTITGFVDPDLPLGAAALDTVTAALGATRRALEAEGYEVQTTRLALPPFGRRLVDPLSLVPLACDLQQACRDRGIDYATIGCASSGDAPSFFHAIPDALAATDAVFASALVADPARGVDLDAVRLAAEVIHRCARIGPDGFGNLRFAALFGVPPGVPFLPAAYHAGGEAAVAIGVEAADLAVTAAREAASAEAFRARLIAAIEEHASRVHRVAAAHAGLRVTGVDFSLAPYPSPERSIGTALEQLTGAPFGAQATLAAVAFVADTVDRARFPRVGYSGIFLPVFEDSVLAARAAEGRVTLNDLLLFSSVCGTGLDTVPLAGDTPPAAIAAILADVAALSLRLAKPLSARLMPIPGKRAGDPVQFDFPYFAPTRVLAFEAAPGSAPLAAGRALAVAPRPR